MPPKFRGTRDGGRAPAEFCSAAQSGDVPAARFGHTTSLVDDECVILFGGATGDSGHYTITADLFRLDLGNNLWTRLNAEGHVPSARAAHAAACVDKWQMVVYGGSTGGGSLADDYLYLLDVRTMDRPQWMLVPVTGQTPGRRYAHSMVFNKPNLIVYGGISGQNVVGDIWALDVERSPFTWTEVSAVRGLRGPPPRSYHGADVCRKGPAAGMMVIFGGRAADNKSLKDTWGLRQHRDSSWDWVEAPTKGGVPPEPRYQHSVSFVGARLVIAGGRAAEVKRPLPTAVYDTETCEWKLIATTHRFRASIWSTGNRVYIYGGFDHITPAKPTGDLQAVDIDRALALANGEAFEDDAAAAPLPPEAMQRPPPGSSPQVPASAARPATPPRPAPPGMNAPTGARAPASGSGISPIKIAQEVFVSHDFSTLVKKEAIGMLQNEGRKMHPGRIGATPAAESADTPAAHIAQTVIQGLLQPATWQPDPDPNYFLLSGTDVALLLEAVQDQLKSEDMLLKVRAPIKVFGDIHGQFSDLMRLFCRYKAPSMDEEGDIETTDYLFLGDFIDRGMNSLETMVLLFSLKLTYPRQIHLIRGNHEDPSINSLYGFRDECQRKLNEDPEEPLSCWNKFNRAFEYLPVAALIEGRILCVHGGIGGAVNSLAQIQKMQRPLHVAQIPQTPFEQTVTDLLWSDPSDSDEQRGVTLNETRDPDGTGRIVKFGPDRVEEFLESNPPLSMVIRAHECVMDGFERFAKGKLITVFSATDYCGHHKNAGALLFVRRDLTIVPKLIYPLEGGNQWDAQILQQRPPTPPRPVADRNMGGDW